jgi:hypothetical protein
MMKNCALVLKDSLIEAPSGKEKIFGKQNLVMVDSQVDIDKTSLVHRYTTSQPTFVESFVVAWITCKARIIDDNRHLFEIKKSFQIFNLT